MAERSSILHPASGKSGSPTRSLFSSPKLFDGHPSKGFAEAEVAVSPTSILETKPFSIVANPFFAERHHRKPYWDNGDSTAVGLGIVDALAKENPEKKPYIPRGRTVLFGSKLQIQIPHLQSNSSSPTGSVDSPHTPIEFGVKNKTLQLALHSPAMSGTEVQSSSPKLFTGCLSPREMELSEDYTCVISYGPNPKKTHIFDNYVVESCGNGFTARRMDAVFSPDRDSSYHSDGFLSFCHACNKSLVQGNDIFMYRGERAFCSRECRQLAMISDDDEAPEDCFDDLLDRL
ncbi:hypothetical protein HPP92_005855 [Vanilla planifolia]|uniref:FLZ-type domain-containing protein n=1 Tax=Vanilla planifolia TaxID=51239 RepID=A0A835VFT5_VANPL|nr:hypothetical protein HPP92_005855 [Vanilla planifolia]